METKTLQAWNSTEMQLTQYLEPGDRVDDTLFDYFREVLPPACDTPDCVQIGEPYDSTKDGYRARYITLHKIGGNWIYVGVLPAPD